MEFNPSSQNIDVFRLPPGDEIIIADIDDPLNDRGRYKVCREWEQVTYIETGVTRWELRTRLKLLYSDTGRMGVADGYLSYIPKYWKFHVLRHYGVRCLPPAEFWDQTPLPIPPMERAAWWPGRDGTQCKDPPRVPMERQQETDYIRAEGEQIPEDAHSGDHVYSEKMVCIEFRENGKCAFGDRCRRRAATV